jgi:hypothetical protein
MLVYQRFKKKNSLKKRACEWEKHALVKTTIAMFENGKAIWIWITIHFSQDRMKKYMASESRFCPNWKTLLGCASPSSP